MTLLELQEILGENIKRVESASNPKEKADAIEKADINSRLAKQMINNADVILRTDKMCGSNERINKVVG